VIENRRTLMKASSFGAIFLAGSLMSPNVCRSDPPWGTVLNEEALGCAGAPCDDQLFDQNVWVQTNLVKSLSALASSVDASGNPIRGSATADASVMPGALVVNIAADGLNGGIAGGVINASWKDTITPTGPGGPGTSADFLVTFTMSGTIGATGLGYNDCVIGGPVANITAGLSGPASFSELVSDCGGTASNQSAVIVAQSGCADRAAHCESDQEIHAAARTAGPGRRDGILPACIDLATGDAAIQTVRGYVRVQCPRHD
jgi:hypothetical protein